MAKKIEGKTTSLFFWRGLKEETTQTVLGLIFLALSIFLLLSSADKAGPVGKAIYELFSFLLGIGYFLIPILFILLGFSSIKKATGHFVLSRIIGSLFFFFAGLGVLDILAPGRAGIIGKIVSTPFLKFFDFYASVFLLFVIIIISLLIILDTPLQFSWFASLFKKKVPKEKEIKLNTLGLTEKDEARLKLSKELADEEKEEKVYKIEKSGDIPAVPKKGKEADTPHKSYISMKPFTPPPLSLLEEDKGKPGVGDIKANANIIKRCLQNFGITVEMDEISIGPSVTRYSLKPAEGVKLSKIVALQNDLALSLAAKSIRIEAPIPGQSLVGIEIPNRDKTTVGLGTILGTEEFQSSDKALLVGLGKSVSGKAHFGNLGKMPHLLLAGSTGSGKSVAIHSLITSLLYRNSPESLRFIMIDPKRVELTLYNKIPHLLTPVITEAKKAILSLKWAAKEMDRRYDILETESVRDIESYHKNILAPALKKVMEAHKVGKVEENEMAKIPETMPYIVIVLDELADIMTTYPRELESGIVRLAQMSRAVGIHLILSTQRPSVDVITGLIKANIPARVALQVSSQIDSRTILDTGGAEKLLGAGDLLYLSGEMSKPLRLQSPFISENEVKNVVKFIVDQYKDELPNEINLSPEALEKNVAFSSNLEDDENPADEDPLYEEAREIVLKAGKASTSYLQRILRVGYARAARLIDMLEENGVIGAGSGAKAREVMGGEGEPAMPEENETEETPSKELL
ncbi:MAG: DNA translocase FtsK [Candidatus Pacebacteria bacterium]|nr:DNA translocase FtsK [Candidatus Paceibacterota bacterium]